ncbi:hypothetical protein NDU88_005132 [Pleurodeles waltl]|uniref:Uncharacterized protein n=1 Tax=Pleurodeles waltl TaxID=8319 RepID=A0AAV7NVQ9_PLEWA|nr:hypothetical protein NDU88_005132 [Pleurodeles waltl]
MRHYEQVRVDNTATLQSLSEVTIKVTALSKEMTEPQQVAGSEEVGMATAKSIALHVHQLTLVQSKIEDLENHQRKNNLPVFEIPEAKEGDDPCQYTV